ISATNRTLADDVEAGRFRRDLFYRLGAFPITVPALHQRRDDIPLLAEHFLRAAATQQKKRVAGIDPAAMERLMQHAWPGNVRELKNEIDRAVALVNDGGRVQIAHLSRRVAEPVARTAVVEEPRAVGVPRPPQPPERLPLRAARERFEADYIRAALA